MSAPESLPLDLEQLYRDSNVADTLEALRKLDGQFAHIEQARRYAPRPYELVVLSDHGQTQGATFKQRNGYGLDELVERFYRRVALRTPMKRAGAAA